MATDNFNRANENPLAAPWVMPGTFSVLALVSNQVTSAGATSISQGYYAGAASGPAQYSEYRVAGIGPGESAAIVRHSTTGGDCYLWYSDAAGDVSFFRVTSPTTYTLLGTTFSGQGGVVNSIMRLEVSGTTLTGKKNGAIVGTQSDGGLSTGQPGLQIYDTTALVDDWAGGNLVTVTWMTALDVDVKPSFIRPGSRPTVGV